MPDAPLLRLARQLDEANRRVRPHTGGLQPLQAALADRSRVARPLADERALQQEALKRFQARPVFESLHQARRVCAGVEAFFESPRLLQAVLDGVQPWRANPRRWRRCFQPLMQSWLAVDTPACDTPTHPRDTAQTKRAGWLRLQSALADSVRDLQDRGGAPAPAWVAAAVANPGFFSTRPFAAFSAELLNGEPSARLLALLASLGASDSPWVQRELVLAAVDQACGLADVDFLPRVEPLLARLARRRSQNGREVDDPTLRAAALDALANRHAQAGRLPMGRPLRMALLAAWGAPWHLSSVASGWGGLAVGARQGASLGLRRDAIAFFFQSLVRAGTGAGAGTDAVRRMTYWQDRAEGLDWVHLALAEPLWRSLQSRAPAAGALPESGAGVAAWRSIAGPLGGSPPSSHVLVMGAGSTRLLEFSEPGLGLGLGLVAQRRSAADADASQAPPAPGEATVLEVGVARLPHRDDTARARRWEQQFDVELRTRFGWRAPDA